MLKSIGLIAMLAAGPVAADILSETEGRLRVTEIADGFDVPWGFAFLPDGGAIVTDRTGELWVVAPDGAKSQIRGLPAIATSGQGGLLDVMVPRDFAQSRELFLTYSKRVRGGVTTAAARARLSADGTRLRDVVEIFEGSPGARGGRHFGSRIVEAADGTLLITMGDRGDQMSSQDLSRHNGSVLRINRDGSVPSDNPFVGQTGALPEIWSYGHRNPQGLAVAPDGTVWGIEHGARGGDEVNLVKPGANYGWPVIAFGVNYNGSKIGEGQAREGMEQPAMYWDPSIAPSDGVFYQGDMFPDWQGDLLVGSLKFDYISRIDMGADVREVERIAGEETGRIRDVDVAPDGAIWFLSETEGAVYRISR